MKKIRLHIFHIFLLSFVFSAVSFSQSVVTGTVKGGTSGIPLAGVSILLEGTATGTLTNDSGQYSIGIPTGVATLRYAAIGYSTTRKTFYANPGANTMNCWIDAATDIDGNKYGAVEIGTQVWMAENLKTTRYNDSTAIPLVTEDTAWADLTTPGFSWFLNDQAAYGGTYGALYNWYVVDGASNGGNNVCPVGWHVPADVEWTKLTTYLGGLSVSGGKLKEAGTAHWCSPNNTATNESGFSAYAGGFRDLDGVFYSNWIYGYWWSATDNTVVDPASWNIMMSCGMNAVSRESNYNKRGVSIRCLKNSIPLLTTNSMTSISSTQAQSGGNVSADGGAPVTARGLCWSTSPNPTIVNDTTWNGSGIGSYTSTLWGLSPDTLYYVRAYASNSVGTAYGDEIRFKTYKSDAITDIEGNYYNIVTIGSQVWMAENLKTTRYNDSTAIPNDTSWVNGSNIHGYCWYNNNEGNYKATYGALYERFTVNSGKLCPTGWHMPLNAEWTILINYLGGDSVAGGKLKETGTLHWISPNTGATNESGFTAVPGGLRDALAGFGSIGGSGYWWSYDGWVPIIYSNSSSISSLNSGYWDKPGLSVRCIKDIAAQMITTTEITSITQTTALSGGNIRSDIMSPIVARGVCWSTTSNPTADLVSKTSDSTGTGTFTSTITGLTPGTIYYVRSYYIMYYVDQDTIYGEEISFITLFEAPLASTASPTAVSSTSATLHGMIYPNGDTTSVSFEYGSTLGYSNNVSAIQSPVVGFDTLSVSANIIGLTPNTSYHFRIKAENSGVITYGDSLIFITPATVTDIDSNTYNAIIIGSQVWMAENLKTTKYNDGTEIESEYYRWYDNDISNKNIYGALYAWQAVNTKKLCPTDWHVPSNMVKIDEFHWQMGDWDILGSYLTDNGYGYEGSGNDIAKSMAATYGWTTSSTPGAVGNDQASNNSSGFTGLPGGVYHPDGYFQWIGERSAWSSSTLPFSFPGETQLVGLNNDDVIFLNISNERGDFASVRCIHDVPTVTTTEITSITNTSAHSGGNITNDVGSPVTDRGICWDTLPNPTISNDTIRNGSGLGVFSINIIGLAPGTTYYVRAYATNSIGTAYGEEISFTTLPLIPTSVTVAPTAVTSRSATLHGTVNANGDTTIATFEYWEIPGYRDSVSAVQNPIAGTSDIAVSASITGLTPNVKYYFRVKAVNSGGTTFGDSLFFTTPDTVTDIDNNSYNTLVLGTQVWMAENLKTTRYSNGDSISDGTPKGDIRFEPAPKYRFNYYDNEDSVSIWGRYYTWYAATDPRNVCPTGWHIPTEAEWSTLSNYLITNGFGFNGTNHVGKSLASTSYWQPDTIPGNVGNDQISNNSSGFYALPGGNRNYTYEDPSVKFYGMGDYVRFQSATEIDGEVSVLGKLDFNDDDLYIWGDHKKHGFSVRCLKGDGSAHYYLPVVETITVSEVGINTAKSGGIIVYNGYSTVTARGVCWDTVPNPTSSLSTKTTDGNGNGIFLSNLINLNPGKTYYVRAYVTNSVGTAYGEERSFTAYRADAIIDIDSNYYNIVKIGSQTWMAENLRVTHFTNGDLIPNVTDSTEWGSLTTPGLSWYNNDEAAYRGIYGALYNWYAIIYSGNLCPAGWQVPSDKEWTALSDYLGGESIAGGKLKESDTIYWDAPNTGATNETGFTALPGGIRHINGTFGWIGSAADFSSSTFYQTPSSYIRHMSKDSTYLERRGGHINAGFSVRCINNPLIVTNVSDNNVGSFRKALEYANLNPGKDTIIFNIPGVGSFTIQPRSALPVIIDPVVIDGYSQKGASESKSELMIELDGSLLGEYQYGLRISGGQSKIKGLVINRFSSSGILITSTGGNAITGNYMGTDVTGKIGKGNSGAGIHILNCSDGNNKIGGVTPSERNVISSNNHGISIINSSKTIVTGNYIGVDVSGKLPLGNKIGIVLVGSAENIIGGSGNGERNVISSNTLAGMDISNASNGNILRGNFIGLDYSGSIALGNKTYGGINIAGASNNIIGGSGQGEGNVISNNEYAGIYIYNITGQDTRNNKITGNRLGTDISGITPMGNDVGVLIANGAVDNKIGDIILGGGNIIAFSKEQGILLADAGTTGNAILSNSIHSNGSLGIDLGQDGTVTENDDDDADPGANNLQNFPVLDSIKYDLGNRSVFISGSLNSTPSDEFTIQFFASRIGDSNGYGEGRTYLGSKKVTTDTGGNVLFADTLTLYSSWGDLITATATDSAGNTSEFSMGIGGLQDQILAGINRPFYFTMNEEGHPNITDGTDLLAIENSFKTWTEIPTADIQFIKKGTTTAKNASANDKVNLVSFTDDKFPFPPGVLAIAAKTLKIIPGNDTAQIIDADIVFNPAFLNHPEIKFGVGEGKGVYDIQSITTHEIGHVLGLLHSGVVNSTMFYMLGPGITVRSLEQDDISWASYRYPEQQAYDSIFGSISGNITYGYGADDDPVAGALVLATDTITGNSVHAYSDAYGDYHVPGLVPGPYEIHIEPLDGNVSGYKLRPGNISLYIYCNTIYTDYANEFYSGDTESAYENQDSVIVVEVTAGSETTGMDLITNRDKILPSVLSVLPDKTDSVDVNQIFKITFSEPVDEKTLTGETCYLTSADDTLTGDFYREGDDSHIILFTPKEAMTYSTEYTLIVTDSITDLKANHLASTFQFTFTTMPPDAVLPQITYTRPAAGADSVFVIEKIIVTFSEPMDKYSVENGFTLKWTEGGTGGEQPVTKEMECSPIWDNKNTEVTFIPSGTLLEGTEYTVSLSEGITDLSGLALKDSIFTFTTVAKANPVILYLGPKNGQTGVTVKTPVVVEFSEPVNPVTVNSESIKLLLVQGTDSSRVTGSFEFLNENSLVVFRPDSDLVSNKQYTVIITEEILDVSQPALNLPDSSVTVFTTAGVVPPQIDNLVPMSGVSGILVTINGSGFDPDPSKNTVLFNGISVQVVDASLTYVKARVPIGAVTGPVKVQVEGSGLSNDFRDFVVLPISLQPCDELVSNVSTGTTGKDVELDSNASFAYVTNPDAGTVSVVDLNTMKIADIIPVGKIPLKIDINPDDTKAYVTNFGSDDVSVIDLKIRSVVKTIPVGRNPYGIVVTPDGDLVYVANYSSPYLSVIDADPTSGGFNHVVANVSTGTNNQEITVTGDAGLVLVTGRDGLKIVCSDPSDLKFNTVVSNVSSGTVTNDVAVTGDAGYALVTTENNTILIVDINPKSDLFGAAVANVSTSTQPGDIVISGDAMFVYVTNTDADKISVYKLSYGASGTINGSFGTYPTLVLYNEIAIKDSIDAPEGLVIDPMNQRLFVVNSGAETGESSLAVIRICCGPVAPSTSIGELVITIQTMINLVIVKEAAGLELIGHLNSSLANYTAGKVKIAINNLNTFIVKVKDLVKSRRITKEQGQALIDAANAIIAQMRGPQSNLTESSSDGTESYDDTELFDNTELSDPDMVSESKLGTIYPNPFSETVTINYEIAENGESEEKVLIRVYDISGRLVGTLINKTMQAGRYTVQWKGNYDQGGPAPYGTYFVLFRAGKIEEVREIMLSR